MLEAENRENRKSKGVKKREQIVDHNNKFTILLLYTYTTTIFFYFLLLSYGHSIRPGLNP